MRPASLCLPTCALFVASIACAPAAFAQTAAPAPDAKSAPDAKAPAGPHFPTTEDLRHIKSIGGLLLSPDGSQVIFTLTESTADGAKTHVWITSTSGSDKPRQLTNGPVSDKRGERSATWSPDGTAIFFVAHRGEHSQLFRLDLRGGEASPYDLKVLPPVDESKLPGAIPPPGAEKDKKTEAKSEEKAADKKPDDKKPDAAPEPLPIDVGGYEVSPDNKWLLVIANDPETPGEKKQKDAKADATLVNHEIHGARLYLAALKPDGSLLEDGKPGTLKPVALNPNVGGAGWSHSGNRILAITEPPNDLSDLGPAGQAWLVDAASPDKTTRLNMAPPTVSGIEFSPDDSTFVFAAQTPEDAPPGYDELFALPKQSSGSPILPLTSGFLGQIGGHGLIFESNTTLIASAAVGTRTTPVRIALDGKSAPAPIDLGTAVVSGLATNPRQTGWVWFADQGGSEQKLCFATHLGDPCKTIPIPDLAPANLLSVKPELVHWKSGEFTVEGLLYLPPAASATTKVPLVVDVHGGPFGAFEDRNDPYAAFLVGHGWAVLRPNPRGSSNYGVKFGAANKNDLGGADYQDIMDGVDAALARYPLDANRMALIGYSYGGEMAGFVEGKTDRFKAIVSGAPVIDQFSEYGTEGGSWYDRWYFGKPWEHMADAWRQSPLAGAALAKTPFMLLQGQSDTTDPLGQAEEMYRALRQEGVPVELVTYPRDDHGPLAIGMFGRPSSEPWHGFDARQRVVEFIQKSFQSASAKP